MSHSENCPLRIDSLTGFRGILASLVLVAHSALRLGYLEDDNLVNQVIGILGHFGVMGFFILSGFILNFVYDKREWTLREFFVNRFARLYPLYILGVLFAFPIDWFSPNFAPGMKLEALGLNLVGLQAWFPFANGRFNGPGWTISVEFFFYLCFPICFWLKKRSQLAIPLIFIGVFCVTVLYWDSNRFSTSYRFPAMRLWEFLFGILLCDIFRKFPIRTSKPWIWALVSLALGPVLAVLSREYFNWDFGSWLLMGGCAAATILFLGKGDLDGVKARPFAGKYWVLAGEISYGVYLLHAPIQRYGKVFFEKIFATSLAHSGAAIQVLYLLLVTFGAIFMAYFSWRFLETPARIFIRKRLKS